jgi:hypothetical protein
MPDASDPHPPRPYSVGGFSRWQDHHDQLRRQSAQHRHLAARLTPLQHGAAAARPAPAEVLADEVMQQVLSRDDRESLPHGRPPRVKPLEAPQRLTAS